MFLFINKFFFYKNKRHKAALKAMIINRISDVLFILGIIIILLNFKTCDLFIVNNILPYYNQEYIIIINQKVNIINIITFFLFIGAIGKSAQIGFHT